MRKTKRFAAAVAALAMAVSMVAASSTMTAFAEESTMSISTASTHTYKVYQIFKGEFQGTDELLFANGATLGEGVQADAFYGALGLTDEADKNVEKALAVLDGKTDTDILGYLTTSVLNEAKAVTLNNDNSDSASVTLDHGYYYIEEAETVGTTTKKKGHLVRFTANETIAAKLGTPNVEKKVAEDDRDVTLGTVMDATLYQGDDYNDAADYCIGEAVPFEVVGSMPENIDDYKNGYYYEFTDRLAKGFVAPSVADIHVYLNGTTDITDKADITVDKSTTEAPATISIKFNNIKNGLTIDKDSKIIVKYNAVLDTDAVIGSLGNTNGVKLKYSNDTEYDGNGITDEDEHDTTEETAEDGVVVFTYTIDTTKLVKGTNTKLAGAKFKLLNGTGTQAATITTDGKFAGWVNVEQGTEITTAADGKFTVAGLDSGTYMISETAAPDGYNPLTEDVTVTLTADLNKDGTWTYTVDNGTSAYTSLSATAPFTVADATEGSVQGANGIASGNVENAKGAELPETGGIGTTMFYVGGGALAAVAGTVLIAKKRAKKED